MTSLSIAAILVTASLAYIGMIQTSTASTSGENVFRARLRGGEIQASASTVEGDIQTSVGVYAFTTASGSQEICIGIDRSDTNLETYYFAFSECGPADQLSVSTQLNSGTFSGTITGLDFVSGEEVTVTVSGDFSATGRAGTFASSSHTSSPYGNIVQHSNARAAPASGTLDVSVDFTSSDDRDFTFSIDATGQIANVRSGEIIVSRS